MFSCLVLNYGSTSTTLPCLTQYSRVKLAISRSLSTSSPRALLRPSSNIKWDEVQGNEDFFGTNGTPDLNAIVINDKPIYVASRAQILGVNIWSDLKKEPSYCWSCSESQGIAVLCFSIKARRCRPQWISPVISHMHPANHWICLRSFLWWSTCISFSRARDSAKDSNGYHFPMFSIRRSAC